MKTTYKGYFIVNDDLLGFSGLDKKENWMCSCSDINQIKDIIDSILN